MDWKIFVICYAIYGYAAAYVTKYPHHEEPARMFGFNGYQCPTAEQLGLIFGELSQRFLTMANNPRNGYFNYPVNPFMQSKHHGPYGRHGYRGYGSHHHYGHGFYRSPPPPILRGSFYVTPPPLPGGSVWHPPFVANQWNSGFPNYPPRPPSFTEGQKFPPPVGVSQDFPEISSDNNKNTNVPVLADTEKSYTQNQPRAPIQPFVNPSLPPQQSSDPNSQIQKHLSEPVSPMTFDEEETAMNSKLTQSPEDSVENSGAEVDIVDIEQTNDDVATNSRIRDFSEIDGIIRSIFQSD